MRRSPRVRGRLFHFIDNAIPDSPWRFVSIGRGAPLPGRDHRVDWLRCHHCVLPRNCVRRLHCLQSRPTGGTPSPLESPALGRNVSGPQKTRNLPVHPIRRRVCTFKLECIILGCGKLLCTSMVLSEWDGLNVNLCSRAPPRMEYVHRHWSTTSCGLTCEITCCPTFRKSCCLRCTRPLPRVPPHSPRRVRCRRSSPHRLSPLASESLGTSYRNSCRCHPSGFPVASSLPPRRWRHRSSSQPRCKIHRRVHQSRACRSPPGFDLCAVSAFAVHTGPGCSSAFPRSHLSPRGWRPC